MFRIVTAAALMALPAAVSAQAMSASTYVMKAGAGDLYEKQSSQLVAGSTGNAKLRSFASQMVTDHTKSTNDVKAAAKADGMTPKPPMLDAMQSRNMAKLRAAKGTARDRMYVEQQKMAHQQALKLHQDYAANGSSASLKTAAGTIAPVVQHHIDELAAM